MPCYSSAPAEIAWGAPASETLASITVEDVHDLNGTTSEMFTAPHGGTIEYSDTFTWDGFGQDGCGDHSFDNTATILETGEADTERVVVKVQCLVFESETAWAANQGPGTAPYNTRGGSWATYVIADANGRTYDLYAGPTEYVGTVTVSAVVDGTVSMVLDLDDSLGYDYAEGTNVHVQGYDSAPSGNPMIGRFDTYAACAEDPCTVDGIEAADLLRNPRRGR